MYVSPYLYYINVRFSKYTNGVLNYVTLVQLLNQQPWKWLGCFFICIAGKAARCTYWTSTTSQGVCPWTPTSWWTLARSPRGPCWPTRWGTPVETVAPTSGWPILAWRTRCRVTTIWAEGNHVVSRGLNNIYFSFKSCAMSYTPWFVQTF